MRPWSPPRTSSSLWGLGRTPLGGGVLLEGRHDSCGHWLSSFCLHTMAETNQGLCPCTFKTVVKCGGHCEWKDRPCSDLGTQSACCASMLRREPKRDAEAEDCGLCMLSFDYHILEILSQHVTFGSMQVRFQELWQHQTSIPRWQPPPGSDYRARRFKQVQLS